MFSSVCGIVESKSTGTRRESRGTCADGKGETGMNELEQTVLQAKTDERCLNSLIASQKQWILRCASEFTHRYITDSDDEWSVSLLAFSEAIQGFDEEKGAFQPFAKVVIRHRLLDYLRTEGRHRAEVAVIPSAFEGDLPEEDAGGVNLQVQQEVGRASMETDTADTSESARDEIGRIQAVLDRYGFSFFDLAGCSPRAEKTRRNCALAVRALLRDEELLRKMRRGRMLPMKELSAESGVARKILDRHRRYLIAAAEILSGEYPILSAYMEFIRKV